MPKIDRKTFNIGEFMNPVYYYGNKIVKSTLQNTLTYVRGLLYKDFSDTNYLRYLVLHVLRKKFGLIL